MAINTSQKYPNKCATPLAAFEIGNTNLRQMDLIKIRSYRIFCRLR